MNFDNQLLGIIGGLGPPSTMKYYDTLIKRSHIILGGHHVMPISIYSMNGGMIHMHRMNGDVTAELSYYASALKSLEAGGATAIIIASNTSHKHYDDLAKMTSLPIIHISESIADFLAEKDISTVGFLGTSTLFKTESYFDRLCYIKAIIPEDEHQQTLDDIIYNRLIYGECTESDKSFIEATISDLNARGAQAIILACTEFTIIGGIKCDTPVFDSVSIHVDDVLKRMLAAKE